MFVVLNSEYRWSYGAVEYGGMHNQNHMSTGINEHKLLFNFVLSQITPAKFEYHVCAVKYYLKRVFNKLSCMYVFKKCINKNEVTIFFFLNVYVCS